MSLASPFFMPMMPSSKPGIIEPEPRTNAWSSPLPPSKPSSSIKPSKLIVTRSPFLEAALADSFQDLRCSRRVAIISLMSAAPILQFVCSISSPSIRCGSSSGKTSKVALNEKSEPSSNFTSSILGWPIGFTSCSLSACPNDFSIKSDTIS